MLTLARGFRRRPYAIEGDQIFGPNTFGQGRGRYRIPGGGLIILASSSAWSASSTLWLRAYARARAGGGDAAVSEAPTSMALVLGGRDPRASEHRKRS